MKREENKPFAADLPAVGEERKPLPAAAASKQQKKAWAASGPWPFWPLFFSCFPLYL